MMNEKVSEMRETIEVENGSRAAGLQNIKDGQQTQPSEISGLKAMIKDILRGFGNLQKGCTEMSKSLRQTLAGNTAILRSVKAIESGLPSALERALDQEQFILEDAIGRIPLFIFSSSNRGLHSRLSSRSDSEEFRGPTRSDRASMLSKITQGAPKL